jgi:hypothetical protein
MNSNSSAKVFGLATGLLIIDEDGNRVANRKLFEEVKESKENYKLRVREGYKKRINKEQHGRRR